MVTYNIKKPHPDHSACGFLAEMKRFELLRRFEADLPHFECVRNFRTWRNLTEDGGSYRNPQKARVSAGFEKTEEKKEREFLGREVPTGRGKF